MVKDLPKPVSIYYEKLLPKIMQTDPIGLKPNKTGDVHYNWLEKANGKGPRNKGDHRIWAHNQVCLGAQTLMLSAAAHGYDSCPMGGFDMLGLKIF